MRQFVLLWRERLIEAVLIARERLLHMSNGKLRTIDKIMTHGKFSDCTISIAKDVFPDPELPATPIMLMSAHGGE